MDASSGGCPARRLRKSSATSRRVHGRDRRGDPAAPKNDSSQQLPLLANLPLSGFVYRQTNPTPGREEVLALITPRMVRGQHDGSLGDRQGAHECVRHPAAGRPNHATAAVFRPIRVTAPLRGGITRFSRRPHCMIRVK